MKNWQKSAVLGPLEINEQCLVCSRVLCKPEGSLVRAILIRLNLAGLTERSRTTYDVTTPVFRPLQEAEVLGSEQKCVPSLQDFNSLFLKRFPIHHVPVLKPFNDGVTPLIKTTVSSPDAQIARRITPSSLILAVRGRDGRLDEGGDTVVEGLEYGDVVDGEPLEEEEVEVLE